MDILKEFDKLTPDNNDCGEDYTTQRYWIKTNKHLYEEDVYNEPMYDLSIDKVRNFISQAITKTREETIREEIAYWTSVFDNKPKDRDLESDNIAQNFARIEIERLENKLKK